MMLATFLRAKAEGLRRRVMSYSSSRATRRAAAITERSSWWRSTPGCSMVSATPSGSSGASPLRRPAQVLPHPGGREATLLSEGGGAWTWRSRRAAYARWGHGEASATPQAPGPAPPTGAHHTRGVPLHRDDGCLLAVPDQYHPPGAPRPPPDRPDAGPVE